MHDEVPFRTFVGTSYINHVRSSEAASDTLLFLIETYFWPEHATDRQADKQRDRRTDRADYFIRQPFIS